MTSPGVGATTDAPPQPAPLVILFAQRDTVAGVACEAAARCGARFIHERSRERADALLATRNASLAILDAGFPGHDALMRLAHARALPVLAIGHEREADIERSLQEGATDALGTPISAAVLAVRIRLLMATSDARRNLGHLEHALHAATRGIAIAHPQQGAWPIVWANRVMERRAGAAPGGLLGTSLFDPTVARADRAALIAARAAVHEGRNALLSTDDGTAFSVDPTHASDGEIDGCIAMQERAATETSASKPSALPDLEGVVRERTMALRAALEDLDERRRFTETVLNAITAGVLVCNGDRLISLANRMALATLERHAGDCLGLPVEEVFAGAEALRDVLLEEHGPVERRLEFTFTTPSRRQLDIGMTIVRIGEAAGPRLKRILLFRDMGDLRQIEIEVRRTRGLSALGQMAAGWAHEVRNPLAAMRSISEALLTELRPDDPHREYARRLLAAQKRVERLVSTSLHFAQPREPEPETCHIDALIAAALEILRKRTEHGGPARVLEADLPAVRIDEGHIVETLVALLENAFDAGDDPRTVTIRAHRATATVGMVRIDVVDRGPGIQAEDLARIFDPFFTTKPNGTGLGLSIAQRLVRDNGGHLWVESTLRQGTTFSLLLPIAE